MNIHAVSHSLPHRGPGASRARARWQPYASTVTSSSIPRSPPSIYLHTPASSVLSVSPPSLHLHSVVDSERHDVPFQQPSLLSPSRDVQKTKYAAKLVDQAVKTLCEAWHPDDIPSVFTACGREALCAQPDLPTSNPDTSASPCVMQTSFSKLFTSHNNQLPSPVSPSSGQTPSLSGGKCESYSQAPDGSAASNLIPIKGFVHEVLRRSRTSTGVLQTALCYLEAVRSKVPELLQKEKANPISERHPEEAPEPRIVQALYAEGGSADAPINVTSSDTPDKTAGPTLETIRIGDTILVGDVDPDVPTRPLASAKPVKNETSLPPLPPLPSPLCCPRRTFLACLILASKFLQDRSYSNRAWAKLAGLPPREIGRCERALGQALEWRLWVGKIPASSTAPSGLGGGRSVTRSKSEGDVLYGSAPATTCTAPSAAAWAAAVPAGVGPSFASSSLSIPAPVPPPRNRTRGLQRSATVPVFGTDRSSVLTNPYLAPTSDGYGYSYDARLAPGSGYESAFAMDVEPLVEVSPVMSTPTLSYSPMSSASSSSDGSEEQTIQMSMFVDLPTPALSSFGANGPWVANSSAYTPADPTNPFAGSYGPIHPFNSFSSNPTYIEVDAAEKGSNVSVGPMLAVTKPMMEKQRPVLPSFAEVFSNSCPGILGPVTQ